jgi:hypothetical protein
VRRKVYAGILVEKPEGMRPLRRPRLRWEDNIRTDLQEVFRGREWIDLVLDRDSCWAVVSVIMNLRLPYNAGSFLTSGGPVSFSRGTVLHGVSQITCSTDVSFVCLIRTI